MTFSHKLLSANVWHEYVIFFLLILLFVKKKRFAMTSDRFRFVKRTFATYIERKLIRLRSELKKTFLLICTGSWLTDYWSRALHHVAILGHRPINRKDADTTVTWSHYAPQLWRPV